MSHASLTDWLQSGGRQLIALEQAEVQSVLPGLVGYRLLQIGCWGFGPELFSNSPMLQHWVLGLDGAHGAHARCDGRTLPLASRSVDAVLLPHSLEWVGSAHRLLREVDRVLCPHGHVVILGFNPWGLWSLRQTVYRGKSGFPRGGRRYSLNRVRDWLELLDFEITELRRFGSGFPRRAGSPETAWSGAPLQALLAPLSQAYLVVARKRTIPLTPQRLRWPRQPVVTPAVLPEARVHRMPRPAAR